MQMVSRFRYFTNTRYAVTYFSDGVRYIEHFRTYRDACSCVYAIAGYAKDVRIWDGIRIIWEGSK